ncbi:MAG: glycosyltransferase [Clostridiales bacterium]|nr:glycosyltransferase [Clostridiales bacterium]
MKPFFSIIVPVYNVEDYLDECVQSVLLQTFKDFELILVDDGSVDKSPQMCDTYAECDSRIRVVHNQNEGASAARNIGIDNALGDYILFLDSDDFWNTDNALSILKNKISDNPDTDCVIFGCTDWNMNTGESTVSRTGYNHQIINKGDKFDTLHYLLSSKMLPGGPTIFTVKKSVIDDNKIRFHTGTQNEDFDFVLSIFLNCNHIFALDSPFYMYRKGRKGSVTGSSNIKMIYEIEYTINKWFPVCAEINDDRLKRDALNYLSFIYTTGFVISERMDRANRKEAVSVMKKI